MRSITPWLKQIGTWVIATGVATIVDKAASWYYKTENSAEAAWTALMAKSAFLTALTAKHGIPAAKECYIRGIISQGELFYCTVLSWAIYDAPLSNAGIEILEAYGIEQSTDVDYADNMPVGRASATSMSNDPVRLGQAMAHVRSFIIANQIQGALPPFKS